jgi:tripeptide aminopeptidase
VDNFHGKYEYVPVEKHAKKAVNVIVKIAELTAMPNFGLEKANQKKK